MILFPCGGHTSHRLPLPLPKGPAWSQPVPLAALCRKEAGVLAPSVGGRSSRQPATATATASWVAGRLTANVRALVLSSRLAHPGLWQGC